MNPKASFWPTPAQRLLLGASFLEGAEALQAWRDLKSGVDTDRLDHASQRLLPLVYWNLRSLGVDDPLLDRCRAAYRVTGFQNERVFEVMADLLRSFRQAGIDTLVLKGAALTVLHYRDHGLRPMFDFDVLVPTSQAREAVRLLAELGWRPELRPVASLDEAYFSTRHSHPFQHPSAGEFDLHWHVLLDCCYPGADDDFWAGAVPLSIGDVPTLALNPADQLLHVCVHGTPWSPLAPIRWIADALMILRSSGGEVDWDRLVAQAERRRLILPMSDALSYLRDEWHAAVPRGMLEALGSLPVSGTERLEHDLRGRPPGVTGSLMPVWFGYLRSSQGAGGKALRPSFNLVGLARRLQHLWHLEHLRQVPLAAAGRGTRRIRWWMTGQSQVLAEGVGQEKPGAGA